MIRADWVVSRPTVTRTIHDLLDEQVSDGRTDKAFASYETFPSICRSPLGVASRPVEGPGYLTLVMENSARSIRDPLAELSFRLCHYDPTFAPPAKTAVMLPAERNVPSGGLKTDYRSATGGEASHSRRVVAVLERRLPGVSTPSTPSRYRRRDGVSLPGKLARKLWKDG